MKRKLYRIDYKTWEVIEVPWTSFREQAPGYHETEMDAKKTLSLWLNGQMHLMHERWRALQVEIGH